MTQSLQGLYTEVIQHFGGQQKTADALNVKQSSVTNWKRGISNMKPLTAAKVQELTGGDFKAADLCPELKEVLAILDVA